MIRRRFVNRDEPDHVLAARAGTGDRDALETLLRRHYDRVLAVCRRITANEADAADAAQQALIAISRGIQAYDGRAAFSTWAYRVAVNASLDELRRRGRRPLVGLPSVSEAPDRAPVDEAVADRLDVERALADLPEEYRVAVVLRDLLDFDYAQIAEVLGIPPGTVRSRIARGRALLADRMGNQAGPPRRPRGQP